MKKNNIPFYFILAGLILLISACSNPGGNNNSVNQGADSSANMPTKGLSIKEKQRFHTHAQRSLDSLQRLINNKDKEMRKQDEGSRAGWNGTRDSLRRMIDMADRTLNSQSYKSDDDWKRIEMSVNSSIDSAQSILRRDKY